MKDESSRSVTPNADLINRIRKRKGLTVEEFAFACDIGMRTAQKVVAGMPVQISTVKAVAKTFGESFESLLLDADGSTKTSPQTLKIEFAIGAADAVRIRQVIAFLTTFLPEGTGLTIAVAIGGGFLIGIPNSEANADLVASDSFRKTMNGFGVNDFSLTIRDYFRRFEMNDIAVELSDSTESLDSLSNLKIALLIGAIDAIDIRQIIAYLRTSLPEDTVMKIAVRIGGTTELKISNSEANAALVASDSFRDAMSGFGAGGFSICIVNYSLMNFPDIIVEFLDSAHTANHLMYSKQAYKESGFDTTWDELKPIQQLQWNAKWHRDAGESSWQREKDAYESFLNGTSLTFCPEDYKSIYDYCHNYLHNKLRVEYPFGSEYYNRYHFVAGLMRCVNSAYGGHMYGLICDRI